MESCLNCQHFFSASLILLFLKGVTSQDTVVINYEGPNEVFEGTPISFTGTTTSETPESWPIDVSFFVKKKNSDIVKQICNVDYGDCGDHLNMFCYCSSKDGDTYHFVVKDTATLERSEALLSGYIGFQSFRRYPKIIARPTSNPTTLQTTARPTSKATTLQTTARPTSKATTLQTAARPTTKPTTLQVAALADQTNGSDGRGISERYTIVIGIFSVGGLALLK